ncbi:MAG: hypothetical protein IJI14_15920 [Anaerolineaceae bacterium]|nr:hypothetical protein [Anaerolineaceae bacterium]
MREYEGKTPFERETLKKIKTRFYFFDEDKSYYYEDIDTKQKDIENRNILIYCIGKRNSDELLLVYDYFHNNSSLFDVYDPVSTEDQDTKLSQSAEKYGFFVFGLSDAGCFSTKENKIKDIQRMISFVLDFQNSTERTIPSIEKVTENIKNFLNNKFYYETHDGDNVVKGEETVKHLWSSQIDKNNRIIRLDVQKNINNTFTIRCSHGVMDPVDKIKEGSLDDKIEKIIRKKILQEYISDDSEYPVFLEKTDYSKIPEYVDRLNNAVIAYQESWENRYELPYIKEFLERSAVVKEIRTKINSDKLFALGVMKKREKEKIVDDFLWCYDANDLDLPGHISNDILVHIENEEELNDKILRFMSDKDKFGDLSVESRSTLPFLYNDCAKFTLFVTSRKDYFMNDFCFGLVKDLVTDEEYTQEDVFVYTVISTSEQTWKHLSNVVSLREAVQMLKDVVNDTRLLSPDAVYGFKSDPSETPSTSFYGIPELSTYCSTAQEIKAAVEKHYTVLMEYQRRLSARHPELLSPASDAASAEKKLSAVKESSATQPKRGIPVVPVKGILRGFDKAKVNSTIIAETSYKKSNGETIKLLITKTGPAEVKVSSLKDDTAVINEDLLREIIGRFGLEIDPADKTICKITPTSEMKKIIDFISVCILDIDRVS